VGCFLVPFLWLVRLSFHDTARSGFYVEGSFTLDHYAAILTDPYFRHIGWATLQLGALVTVAAMTLAYPLAVYIWLAGPRLKTGAVLAVLLPKLTNVLVALYGVMVLLARSGPINQGLVATGLVGEPLPMFANLFAVVVGETLIVAPYPVLIIATALHGVDRDLIDSARGMGDTRWRAFYEVAFKLTLPSTILAALVTLIWAAGAFTAPVVLGNPDLYPAAVEVYTQTFEAVDWPMGAAVAVTNTILVMLLVGAVSLVQLRAERVAGRAG
jgi:ABC-type spermidine/putrescine transport system permease subunit I